MASLICYSHHLYFLSIEEKHFDRIQHMKLVGLIRARSASKSTEISYKEFVGGEI
jgi:hypothetical protein